MRCPVEHALVLRTIQSTPKPNTNLQDILVATPPPAAVATATLSLTHEKHTRKVMFNTVRTSNSLVIVVIWASLLPRRVRCGHADDALESLHRLRTHDSLNCIVRIRADNVKTKTCCDARKPQTWAPPCYWVLGEMRCLSYTRLHFEHN